MKLKGISFTKKENPKTVTVEMTIDEAAAIAKVFGGMNPLKFGTDFPSLANKGIVSSVYDCLSGAFFNRYYDDGVDDYL